MNQEDSGFRVTVVRAVVALATVAVCLPARAYAPLLDSNDSTPLSTHVCEAVAWPLAGENACSTYRPCGAGAWPPVTSTTQSETLDPGQGDADTDIGATDSIASDTVTGEAFPDGTDDSFNMTADAGVPEPGIAGCLLLGFSVPGWRRRQLGFA
ncbi:MAG: hypothetical protein ABSH56_08170 [Bryobacteraceae bacterium]|jgi:hypothetical protein